MDSDVILSANLAPIRWQDARARVVSFCANPHSGWVTYDLAAYHARQAGWLDVVSPWSLLFADALAGQVTIRHVADFSLARREEFVRLLRLVPAGVDLADTDAEQLEALIDLCMFGFPGVWGPKVTKMAALFRPRIVPILDGYVAAAFGYQRDAFSVGGTLRRDRIRRVVEELRDILSRYRADLAELRAQVAESIPEIELISDVRILDIVIWTTQDDSISRPRKPVNAWLDAVTGERVSVQDVRPVRVAT